MQRSAIAIVITLALASLGLGAWMLSGVPSHREGPRAAEGNAIVAGAVTLPVESAPGPRTNVEAAAPSASAAPTDAAPTDAAIDDPRPVSDSADPVPLLSGSVVFPQGFTRAMFRVAFRRPGDQTTLPIHLAADGAFRLFRAAPGMVSVLVELRDDPPPLATILDVELPSVGTNADPRLQHLAFPDLRQLTLRVVDEVGAPIAAQIGVLAFTPGTDQGRRWFRQGGAAITVPARHRPQRVQVWSTGRVAVELDVDDKATVMLPRAAVVAFHFRVDPALLARHGFRLGLRPRGGRLDAVRGLPPKSTRVGDTVQAGKRGDVTVDPGSVALPRTTGPASSASFLGAERHGISPCLVSCGVAGFYEVVWTTIGEDPVVRGHGPEFEVASGRHHEVEFELTPEAFAAARK